jgi:tRNA(Ile)-lysidine synthase
VKSSLPKRVLRFIREYSLIEKPMTLLIGVSGGPDSVCLLHTLDQLRDELGIELYVAHLNHMLRGAESDADAEYVLELTHRLGIPATIESRDVNAYRKRQHCSLEEAAREVRYAFFANVAQAIAADTVAVGHTADDQVETILLHLIRGSGTFGLRGMQPLTVWRSTSGFPLRVIRPLLGTDREETEAYCRACGLAPRWDSSNRSPAHLRNRIRLELIPLLKSYNPNIKAALRRTAHILAAEGEFWQGESLHLGEDVVQEQPNGIAIDNRAFSSLPIVLKQHLLLSALKRLLGNSERVGFVHIEGLLKALDSPAGKRLSLPGGLVFYGDYQRSTIAKGAMDCSFPALQGERQLSIPGKSEFCGWQVSASILEPPVEASEAQGTKAYLDLDACGQCLLIRGRKSGDRFQPLGMESPKKLQDFMVDAKIPRILRDRIPIVCSPQHIIWVVGYRIDHRVRLTPQTKRILHLEFSLTSP